MSKKDDGGLAFPFFDEKVMNSPEWGISLRDYFAAKVDVSVYTPFNNLQVILNRKPTIAEMAEYISTLRYIEADLMLAERAK